MLSASHKTALAILNRDSASDLTFNTPVHHTTISKTPRRVSMSTNKIVRFVLAATASGLMLAAASGPSFAGGYHGPPKPQCGNACQSNKAVPPTKLQPAKSTGSAGERSAHPR
jgi:hypothetical protein